MHNYFRMEIIPPCSDYSPNVSLAFVYIKLVHPLVGCAQIYLSRVYAKYVNLFIKHKSN